MGRAFLVHLCTLALLCPLTLSQPDVDVVTKENQISLSARLQNSLLENDDGKTILSELYQPSPELWWSNNSPIAPRSRRELAGFAQESDVGEVRTDIGDVEDDNAEMKIQSGGDKIIVDAGNKLPSEKPPTSTLTTEFSEMEPSLDEMRINSPPTIKRFLKEATTTTTQKPYMNSRISRSEPKVHRNMSLPQLETITAYEGTLLVKPLTQSFFESEEEKARYLITLRFPDRKELPSSHWLQFDQTTLAFYGVPDPENVGVEEYLLTAENLEDNSKNFYFVTVIVEKRPILKPQVEFHITLETSYIDFLSNAKMRRRLIEKIAFLFDHPNDTSIIRIANITEEPTTIVWYNTTLPSDRCPVREIDAMLNVISSGDPNNHLKETVEQIFDNELKVISITIIPLDQCLRVGALTKEIMSIYTGASARMEDVKLGVTGITNSKIGERKLIAFVIPTFIFSILILGAITSLYLLYTALLNEDEHHPCLRFF